MHYSEILTPKKVGSVSRMLKLAAALLVIVSGCSQPPPSQQNPLQGWHCIMTDSPKLDRAIVDDAMMYAQTLVTERTPRISRSNLSFFEDGTGMHAAEIQVPANGTILVHVLFYNQKGERTRTTTFIGGHYRS
jgi:hypothetical protein